MPSIGIITYFAFTPLQVQWGELTLSVECIETKQGIGNPFVRPSASSSFELMK